MKLRISEQDLFNYIFFRNNLDPKKIEMIRNHPEFEPALSFYTEFHNAVNRTIPYSAKLKIAEKIIAYKPAKIFDLNLIRKTSFKIDNSKLVLAAASETYQSKSVSSTYLDEGKNILIRVINTVNEKLIYVFSTNESIIKDFKVIIHPSNLVLSSQDNTKPIKVDSKTDIESITVEIQ